MNKLWSSSTTKTVWCQNSGYPVGQIGTTTRSTPALLWRIGHVSQMWISQFWIWSLTQLDGLWFIRGTSREIQYDVDITPSIFSKILNRYPIARPWVWYDIGCLLWQRFLVYVLPQSLQCCVQYAIFDRVITAPEYMNTVCVLVFDCGLAR